MLVQRRPDGGLRLFEQHAHGLVCGSLAQAWRGVDEGAEELGFETILGIGLHDYAWYTDDCYALLQVESGRPCDFLDYPMARRLTLYTDGVDALAGLHPYAATLVSLHYCALSGMQGQEVFQGDERRRRERLAARLPRELRDAGRQQRDLELLQLFDLLSLYLCLGPPSADVDWLPDWLRPANFARYPGGQGFTVRWEGDGQVSLDPSPWRGPFVATLPYRPLERATFVSQDELDQAFRGAERVLWRLTIA